MPSVTIHRRCLLRHLSSQRFLKEWYRKSLVLQQLRRLTLLRPYLENRTR